MKYQVPFHKPKFDYFGLDKQFFERDLKAGRAVNGMHTDKLQRYFRATYNVKHAIACASCTAGLTIAIKAAGIRHQFVALPAFTWPSTRYAVDCNWNQTLFHDIDEETWLLKDSFPLIAAERYNRSTPIDAVVSVDTFGNQSDIHTTLPVIYDAAHGFGLPKLGNRGLAEVVSFSFTKAVTAMQGGMILTNDDNLAMHANEMVQLTAKMCEINAMICINSINDYPRQQKIRHAIMDEYRHNIKIPFWEQAVNGATNYSVFAILTNHTKERDRIVRGFKKYGIEVKVYYEPLVSYHKNTDSVYSRIIALPVYEEMRSEIPLICDLINGDRK